MNKPCPTCGNIFASLGRQQHCSVTCRFLSKVDFPSTTTCWLWVGPKDIYGYGQLRIDGTLTLVHRWAYENLGGGTLIPGLVLDHVCRDRSCVNPRHLEQVTQRENMMRGELPAVRTYLGNVCQRGHSMDNAMVLSSGRRYCRACKNAGARRRYAEAKGTGA